MIHPPPPVSLPPLVSQPASQLSWRVASKLCLHHHCYRYSHSWIQSHPLVALTLLLGLPVPWIPLPHRSHSQIQSQMIRHPLASLLASLSLQPGLLSLVPPPHSMNQSPTPRPLH